MAFRSSSGSIVGWRRLVEDVRQFVLSVMLDQRGNADLLELLARGLFVDGYSQSVYRSKNLSMGLRETGYIADSMPPTTVYLAAKLHKPLLLGRTSRKRKNPIGVCGCGRREHNG